MATVQSFVSTDAGLACSRGSCKQSVRFVTFVQTIVRLYLDLKYRLSNGVPAIIQLILRQTSRTHRHQHKIFRGGQKNLLYRYFNCIIFHFCLSNFRCFIDGYY